MSTIPPISVMIFDLCWPDHDIKIYVPRNAVEAYKSADGWKEYADYIEGYDF
jgi:hypothetical protein